MTYPCFQRDLDAKKRSGFPIVSIIIPFYNQPLFLAEAVQSARRQTYPNIEIIVIDDGSPIPATSVLAPSDDVLLIRTENQKCAAARNFGSERSKGEFLVFLDSDDRLTPDAVERHLEHFSSEPEGVLCFGAAAIIDETGGRIHPPHVCRPRKDYFLMFLEGNPITCPGAMMIRRSAFLEVGRFEPNLWVVEDYLLYLQVAKLHPVLRTSACVVEYRHHAKSISQDKERMLQTTLGVLDRISVEMSLSSVQKKRLSYGRKRWIHEFRRKDTLIYRIKSLYYSFRAMLSVPLMSYMGDRRTY